MEWHTWVQITAESKNINKTRYVISFELSLWLKSMIYDLSCEMEDKSFKSYIRKIWKGSKMSPWCFRWMDQMARKVFWFRKGLNKKMFQVPKRSNGSNAASIIYLVHVKKRYGKANYTYLVDGSGRIHCNLVMSSLGRKFSKIIGNYLNGVYLTSRVMY